MLHLLWDYLKEVSLTKKFRGYYYNPIKMLFVWISGTICGQKTMKDCWIWANSEKARNLLYYEIGLKRMPCYSNFTILLEKIDSKSLEKQYRKWIKLLLPENLTEKVISFDGKTVKTTANMSNFEQCVHIVSAYATELGLTLGQLAVDDKTNEIPTVQKLIKELDLEGTIVVADALNCQKKQRKQ
jgi:hypothetical protein